MALNNYLQRQFGSTRPLRSEVSFVGPQHAGHWTAICYCTSLHLVREFRWLIGLPVNDVEYGRGTAQQKSAALQIAGEKTPEALLARERGYN